MSTEDFEQLTLKDLTDDNQATKTKPISFQESIQKKLRAHYDQACNTYGFDFANEMPMAESKDAEIRSWSRAPNEIEY